ncbi:polysaccharide deacetylase family protein [Paenibacillus soyae]|uniref:Polysaccharide deacetylase family protein n=1 Tax=Paenibacillus soyae TaxID=2969249 RepID=A0A9X2MUH4_9BACL|nr:polysaccharide deacetylase family protein [Paenibacillus soyae]MCR2806537.1 polysaccharide deacetylase family protein [Paenibacillus soyae]
MGKVSIRFDRFPGGRSKAVVLSFDDGRDQDRRLVQAFNRYGLRGTFHLNSGNLGKEGYVGVEETADLYRGHEISAHTVTHPFLEQSPADQIAEEILSDRANLEAIAGYPVRGMSYPFGTYNDSVVRALPALGIEYARTVQSHGSFHMPEDLLRWHPTCHHKDMVAKAEQLLASKQRFGRMELLFIWGHSYEFDHDDNWELVDKTGELLGGEESVWKASMMDIVSYQNALQSLRFSVDRSIVYNPGALDVWFTADGEAVKIGAGETKKLR